MKITLALDPVEDGPEKIYQVMAATDMFSAVREYAEWLRDAGKYAADDAEVRSAGPQYFRDKLYAVLEDHGITLEA